MPAFPTPAALLDRWLHRALTPAQAAWLDAQRGRVRAEGMRALHLAVGAAGGRLARTPLSLAPADLADAATAREGWDPSRLDAAAAARILLLLEAGAARGAFAPALMELLATADVAEAVALYRGLPLYPAPDSLGWQVGEGLRTSVAAIFAAIAHHSPFPAERFDEDRWNHMVLKALFLGLPLAPIRRFDARRNPALAEMARRYADERRAAGRTVDPELWRCVASFATGRDLAHLQALAASRLAAERAAAALALAEVAAPLPVVLAPERAAIEAGALTWSTLPEGCR